MIVLYKLALGALITVNFCGLAYWGAYFAARGWRKGKED